jgi:hypothetical protein
MAEDMSMRGYSAKSTQEPDTRPPRQARKYLDRIVSESPYRASRVLVAPDSKRKIPSHNDDIRTIAV